MSLKFVFNVSKIFHFSANPSSGQTTASTTFYLYSQSPIRLPIRSFSVLNLTNKIITTKLQCNCCLIFLPIVRTKQKGSHLSNSSWGAKKASAGRDLLVWERVFAWSRLRLGPSTRDWLTDWLKPHPEKTKQHTNHKKYCIFSSLSYCHCF